MALQLCYSIKTQTLKTCFVATTSRAADAITLHARGDKRAAPHACMRAVIGSLIVASKAVHSCDILAEFAFQLSLAYTRNNPLPGSCIGIPPSVIPSSHNTDDTFQHHTRTPYRSSSWNQCRSAYLPWPLQPSSTAR